MEEGSAVIGSWSIVFGEIFCPRCFLNSARRSGSWTRGIRKVSMQMCEQHCIVDEAVCLRMYS